MLVSPVLWCIGMTGTLQRCHVWQQSKVDMWTSHQIQWFQQLCLHPSCLNPVCPGGRGNKLDLCVGLTLTSCPSWAQCAADLPSWSCSFCFTCPNADQFWNDKPPPSIFLSSQSAELCGVSVVKDQSLCLSSNPKSQFNEFSWCLRSVTHVPCLVLLQNKHQSQSSAVKHSDVLFPFTAFFLLLLASSSRGIQV